MDWGKIIQLVTPVNFQDNIEDKTDSDDTSTVATLL